MTLIEVLIASAMALVLVLAMFAFLEAVTKSSANDQERSNALVEGSEAVHDMAEELGQAYEYKEPLLETAKTALKSNYVNLFAWVTAGGGAQVKKRLVFDCEEESAEIAGEKACVRYEAATTDTTAIASLKSDSSAVRRVVVPRVLNTSANKVFELTAEHGGTTPTYGQISIETPAAGRRVNVKSDHGYAYAITLRDAFYLPNLEFAT